MRKYAARLISAIFVLALVTGCTYTHDESRDDSSSAAESSVRSDWTVQELLSPKGAIHGTGQHMSLPASGPCSYAEAVNSYLDIDHKFPVQYFAGVGRALAMIRVEMGVVVVYRTYAFDQLKWKMPEVRDTSARIIRITEGSFERVLQRDKDLRTLLTQIEQMGPFVRPPYYIVDKACLPSSRSIMYL